MLKVPVKEHTLNNIIRGQNNMRLNVKKFVDEKYPHNTSARLGETNINQFAKSIGIGRDAAEKIYEGETTRISFDTLEAICRELECTPNEIIVSDDPTVSRLLLIADKIQRDEDKD